MLLTFEIRVENIIPRGITTELMFCLLLTLLLNLSRGGEEVFRIEISVSVE